MGPRQRLSVRLRELRRNLPARHAAALAGALRRDNKHPRRAVPGAVRAADVIWFTLIVLALILSTVPIDRHPWPAVCIASLTVAVIALDFHVRGLL
ncbi:hypothetical protein EHF33_20460 (plasmid) [Deinococcus psychrotolerans]|uniref:Uncharacterized protein n=1 Tax=Deinococcus psychrotolerans TaxID=2489213 RepID=A0A3G8YK61_9DEIO|nr:hypothetical protein [Deinococcus psychrotolerans]AZI45285.1 hypothetical protein EHF33_20460 [Deinococcus psychrotolerans]